MKVDLHIHTAASDGTYTPSQIIKLAKSQSISFIAITDHDTVDGIEESIAEGKKENIGVIPGIELSLNYPEVLGSIHLLGLYIDHKSNYIKEIIQVLKEYRIERNLKIFEKAKKLNIKIDENDFKEIPLDTLGRAHIAAVLEKKGYVNSINEAFERYLKKGGELYVNKRRYRVEEGIEIIHNIGGVAILAHPYTTKLNNNNLEIFVKYLINNCKLDGIEVFYPEHSPRFVDFYYQLAKKLDLIITGGSDFHGFNKPNVSLLSYLQNQTETSIFYPEETLKNLEKRVRYYEKTHRN